MDNLELIRPWNKPNNKMYTRPDYVWKLFTSEKIISMYASNLWFQSPEAVNVLSSAQSRLRQG
jgi:hypothetical protein